MVCPVEAFVDLTIILMVGFLLFVLNLNMFAPWRLLHVHVGLYDFKKEIRTELKRASNLPHYLRSLLQSFPHNTTKTHTLHTNE